MLGLGFFVSVAASSEPQPSTVLDFALTLETKCLIPVTPELDRRGQNFGVLDMAPKPLPCSGADAATRLNALTDDCSFIATWTGRSVNLAVAEVGKSGCQRRQSPLDLTVGSQQPNWTTTGMMPVFNGLQSHGEPWVPVVQGDGDVTRRDWLESRLAGSKEVRPPTWYSIVNTKGKAVVRVVRVGGPYTSMTRADIPGPYSHKTMWWVPSDVPAFRPATDAELDQYMDLLDDYEAGKISDRQYRAAYARERAARLVGFTDAQVAAWLERELDRGSYNEDGSYR